MLFPGIGTVDNDLGRGVSMDRPVELVLRRGEKLPGDGGIFVVVGQESVNGGDFLVETALAGTDPTVLLIPASRSCSPRSRPDSRASCWRWDR